MSRLKTTASSMLALLILASAAAAADDPVAQKLAPAAADKPAVVQAYPILLKDPFVATYMSATLPGMGQWYAGSRGRGLAFFAATVGALGATFAFVEPAVLELADYDLPENGGNGDGIFSITEAQNWRDEKYQDNAFERLSTGRKVGAITSGVTALGLYIWNIVDARATARKYNEKAIQRRLSLNLLPDPDRAGLALNLSF